MIETGMGKVRPAKSGKSFGKFRRQRHRQAAPHTGCIQLKPSGQGRGVPSAGSVGTPVARQSGRHPYCLIQECSRAGRALPHQNAPDAASVCQSTTRSGRLNRLPLLMDATVGLNRLSCSIGKPAFPSRPGAPNPRRAAEGDWEERSHPQPRAACSCTRAWRGWRAPDLPRCEHRGTLPPSRELSAPLRSVTSRNRGRTHRVK
jgi:hypothetical protein